VVEGRMHTLMGRLDGVNLWDKRQEMEDEQFTPVVLDGKLKLSSLNTYSTIFKLVSIHEFKYL
jgi:hypothetical protein